MFLVFDEDRYTNFSFRTKINNPKLIYDGTLGRGASLLEIWECFKEVKKDWG